MTRPLPNPSIESKGGIREHLLSIGIDYDLFAKMVSRGVKPGSLRTFFRKPDGTMYTYPTIRDWVRRVKGQQ